MTLPADLEKPSGKISVWEIVERTLVERGQETIAGLHRAYKEALKEIYAKELEPFMTWNKAKRGMLPYARPYRVKNKQRRYFKRPPKGMTYLSFARYIYRWLSEGLVERAEEAEETQLTPEQIEGGFKMPVYYRLKE